jgi:flagellar motor switch protein FliN/FliY
MEKPDLQHAKSGATADTDAQKAQEQPNADAMGDAVPPATRNDREETVFPHLDTEDTLNALATTRPDGGSTGINAMLNVGLDVQIVLGQARMPISRLLELTRGSIVELNRKIGAPVDLMVSDRLVARGDLVKIGEDRLGVSLTQIVKDYVPD